LRDLPSASTFVISILSISYLLTFTAFSFYYVFSSDVPWSSDLKSSISIKNKITYHKTDGKILPFVLTIDQSETPPCCRTEATQICLLGW
jgi:hypothetical protein